MITKEQYSRAKKAKAILSQSWPSDAEDDVDSQDLIKLIEALRNVAIAVGPLEIDGIESWATAIVEEWERGERDWSAVKAAEKILVILPDLREALDALPNLTGGDDG